MRSLRKLIALGIVLSIIAILSGCLSSLDKLLDNNIKPEINDSDSVDEANALSSDTVLAEIGDNMLGETVKIRGVIDKVKRFDSGHALARLDDGNDDIEVYFHRDSKTDLSMLITDHEYLISGIVDKYKDEIQILPQKPQDVALAMPIKFEAVKVINVVDGDTIHVENNSGDTETIRIIGVDTPELARGDKPAEFYARQAHYYAETTLLNKTVYLEKDYDDLDQYERKLRYVWLIQPDHIDEATIRSKLFSAQLLAEGYARFVHYNDDRKYKDLLTEIEFEAQNNKLGIWQ